MKVLMLPHVTQFGQGEGGVRRVVEAYTKYLPEFGIEFVGPDTVSYDLKAVHAGVASGADVAHNHGLYWTADLDLSDYEWQANRAVINSLREAKQITVPSQWVAETIRRDMRIEPHVIGHGIDWDDWQTPGDDGGYILWNKNRDFDVCNPEAILRLAHLFPSKLFLSTFSTPNPSPNLRITGQVPFEQMRQTILNCSVYLSSIKETYGIGTLEAMAAGKPILGWANGGNLDLVEHGVNGYLAQVGNYEDLANGLDYCIAHQEVLGDNGREMARGYTWRAACEQVARVYELALSESSASVGVVIPVYNKSKDEIYRSIESCKNQTIKPEEIIVINDGSPDSVGFALATNEFLVKGVRFITQNNEGVSSARNRGIKELNTKYICSLDADDWLDPTFLETCITELEKDTTIGIAYTGLRWHNHQTGESKVSDWPGAYQAAKQFDYEARQNQIPTCCVFRRDAWERVGGYRSRYCPNGAGSEDAAFWSQILSIGYTAKQVTTDPLFNYSLGGQVSGDKAYQEIDWLAWLPFSRDKRYPFACSVPPAQGSHPVRQYDEPELSIVIPVGPGHENDLRTALDSIEAQHFRNWEVVVVFDNDDDSCTDLVAAYPYVKWGSTGGKGCGAGYARNRGAEMARGKFLLFLDADDFLNPAEPNALGEMLEKFWETGDGIYSAHIGRAVVSSAYAKKMDNENRLLAWNEKLSQAYIGNPGIDYDCDQAFLEPRDHLDGKFYIWNLISTLIPRQWHFAIGGFDESMPTWEDWDYWLRMAKAGRCFTRIQKPFLIYNYISGTLRELGLQIGNEVLQYLKKKHDGIEIMGCGCGRAKKTISGKEAIPGMSDDWEEAWYIHNNVGRHPVVVNGQQYGRHVGGRSEHFPVRKTDIAANPHLFEPFQQIAIAPDPISDPQTMPAPEPVESGSLIKSLLTPTPEAQRDVIQQIANDPYAPSAEKKETFQQKFFIDLSSLSPFIQKQLEKGGLTTKEAIQATSIEELTLLKGIGPATAKRIMELAE